MVDVGFIWPSGTEHYLPQWDWGLVSRISHMVMAMAMAMNSRHIEACSCMQVTLHSSLSLSESLRCFLPARPQLYIARYYSRSCRIDMGVFLALGMRVRKYACFGLYLSC